MGMGYGASYADVISLTDVQKFCPREYEILMTLLDNHGVSFDDFACGMVKEMLSEEVIIPNFDNDADGLAYEEALLKALDNLQEAFKKSTECQGGHLSLCLEYHEADDGDRYDEVSGGFFHVEGVYQKTPAGERFDNFIKRCMFVVHG